MSKSETFKITEAETIFKSLGDASLLPGTGRITELRQESLARFQSLGMPTQKQEEWRFTSVAPLAASQFTPVTTTLDSDAKEAVHEAEAEGLLDLTPAYVIFVDGKFRADLSSMSEIPGGITVASLADGAISDPSVDKFLGKIAIDDKHPFMALNNALFSDGLLIHVPANLVIETPIQVLFLTTDSGDAIITNPRILIVAEANSQVTILESYLGPDHVKYFTNSVVEVDLEENAVVDHYRLNLEGDQAFHITTLESRQSRTSNFSTQSVTFGGLLNRNDIGMHLDGQGAFGIMNGLFQISDHQHVDNHTRIDHAQPNCETHELYKGILDDKARGVFNGRIMVRQIAQKTDSKQTNRTLLLSRDALMNTNPQLEIFADDVKCTHGATIGQLDANQLYYLRSRGISEDAARRMLVFAFANDVVERIKLSSLRDYLESRLLAAQEAAAPLAEVR